MSSPSEGSRATAAWPPGTGRALVNLLLFIALMVILWVGFSRHLRPMLAGAVILGGSIGVWALVSLVYGWVKTLVGKKIQSATVELLKGRRVTEPLLFALFIAVMVQLFTASIHLDYGEGEGAYKVEVKEDGQLLFEPMEVSQASSPASRLFLGKMGSPRLTFRIREAPFRQATTRTLKPYGSIRLKVPDDFPTRRLTVIRLLPGVSMMNCYLHDVEARDLDRTFEIAAVIDSREFVARDFRKQPLYLGGSREDLDFAHANQESAALEVEMKDHLTGLGAGESLIPRWMRYWRQEPAMLPTQDLKAGQSIRLELRRRTADGLEAEPLADLTIEVNEARMGKTTSEFWEVTCSG